MYRGEGGEGVCLWGGGLVADDDIPYAQSDINLTSKCFRSIMVTIGVCSTMYGCSNNSVKYGMYSYPTIIQVYVSCIEWSLI